MILNDLFESNMSRVLDAVEDLRVLGDTDEGVREFAKTYGMSPSRWVRAYYPVLKGVINQYPFLKSYLKAPDAHLFHEGDDFGELDDEIFSRIDAEKKRLADLKKNDPEAYAREMAKEKSRRRVMPPVSVFEEPVKEFALGGNMEPPVPPKTKKKDPWEDDDRSIYPRKIQQLLAAGNTVDSRVPGAQGHVFQADDLAIRMKRLNKPYSQKRYAWYIDADRDATLVLKQVRPGHYVLYDRQWMPQGPVAEGNNPWTSKYFSPAETIKKVFAVKTEDKTYNIKAETEQQARDIVEKHEPLATIVSVKFVRNLIAEDPVAEAGLGMWGDKSNDNKKSKAVSDLERSYNKKKQADQRASAEQRDRAWWKAQDDAAKAGKSEFEFDGKKHPLKGKGVKEGLKDPADNPCWKGYKPVGTKKKNGRTVPNCVPKE